MNLGWFELQLLMLISQKERYGYELLNEIRNCGRFTYSTGSLYPTLKRLEKKGYVKTRIQEKEDTSDRVYYSTTTEGIMMLKNIMQYILTIIDRNTWDEIKELRELVILKAEIKNGDVVIDFSDAIGELFVIEISEKVGSSGKVYLIADNEGQKKWFESFFLSSKIENVRIVIGQIPYDKIISSSVDSVVQLIGLHHFEDPIKIINEMKRIVKPGGKIVISDMKKIDHVIFNSMCNLFHPKNQRLGTSMQELNEYLNKLNLENIEIYEWHGMILGVGTKPQEYQIKNLNC
ncbi:MAG: helix-turn-helix transcriptional regulator [Candidatus Hermodarchaeota archaeon]